MQIIHTRPINSVTRDLTDGDEYGYLGTRYERQNGWYLLDDTQLYSPYNHPVSAVTADLLDVAAQVTVMDRITPRPRTLPQNRFGALRGWSRNFVLTLGVREPDRWNALAVKQSLEQFLWWLTEDTWNLTFRPVRRTRRRSDIQSSLFTTPPSEATVILYSGGLDSLAGTVALLRANDQQQVILTTAMHDFLGGVIRPQVETLRACFGPNRVYTGQIPFELRDSVGKEEQTQRTRSFRFLSCGVAQAIACGASNIVVCENGIGSLNLPMNWRQLGTQHTRATHPRTLRQMEHLLSQLGFPHLQCSSPFQFQTKGEICTHLQGSGVESVIAMTVSCDGVPQRFRSLVPGQLVQCGHCTSCILRRQSLAASGLTNYEDVRRYRVDVCSLLDPLMQSNVEELKIMLDQVAIIERALRDQQPIQALVTQFPELLLAVEAITGAPELFNAPKTLSIIELLAHLLQHYAEEWQSFSYQIDVA